MDFSLWLAFLSASIFLSFVPGPDNIFVMTQSAAFGFRTGFYVVTGLCTGLVFQTLCASLGLAAVVAASPWLFGVICAAGALYLLWLAWGAWHAPVSAEGAGSSPRSVSLTPAGAWRRGTIMNITNPKVQIFFLAFFPQFLYQGAKAWPVWGQMAVLGVTFIACTLAVFSTIAFFAGALTAKLNNPRRQKFMNRGTALVFVLLATSALWELVQRVA